MDEMIDTAAVAGQGPAPQPPRRRTPWLVIGAAIVVLGAGVGIGTALGGHGSSGAPAAAATPTASALPVSMDGAITVAFLGTDLYAPQAQDPQAGATGAPTLGDTCVTEGGFTDISQGVAVTVGGPDGKTVAVGSLDAGHVSGTAGQPAQCTFDFEIQVPPGLSEYTVTISHRGTQVFSPAQVLAGDVDLTLGAP